MNMLLRLRKENPIVGLIPFKKLLYAALLSDVVTMDSDEDGVRYGVHSETFDELRERFPEWDSSDESKSEICKAIDSLEEDGLLWFDEENNIYLGEFRGRKFFPFAVKSSLYDKAVEMLQDAIKAYGKSRSAKDKSRSRYIKEQVSKMLDKGVDSMNANDFTELHGYVYELYTGGEVYMIRNKVEYYQTNNMLKAYDKATVFALIVEGTLHFEKFRSRGMPTLTNVAVIKDDVFHSLTHDGSKDYMRYEESSMSDDSEF